jgi:hypothetical protein
MDMVALGVPLRLGGQREIFMVQNETKYVAEEVQKVQKAVVEKERERQSERSRTGGSNYVNGTVGGPTR